jgi:hypothetical protein
MLIGGNPRRTIAVFAWFAYIVVSFPFIWSYFMDYKSLEALLNTGIFKLPIFIFMALLYTVLLIIVTLRACGYKLPEGLEENIIHGSVVVTSPLRAGRPVPGFSKLRVPPTQVY